MRLASLLTVVGFCAFAAVGCASSSSDDDASSESAAMTGIPNTMNLRMDYDVASSTIRATVGMTLAPNEVLRLNVRRGRLPQDTSPVLDCSKLPVAPVMPTGSSASGFETQFVTAAFYDASVEYQGPLVDPSLLATVYPADWIMSHVSAKGLEELQTEGADSIVEACIMNALGTYARSRVQTTIANAWDPNDPILGGRALTAPTPGHSPSDATSAETRTAAVRTE